MKHSAIGIKLISILLMPICCLGVHAQPSGKKKNEDILKQLRTQSGSISFTIKGKTYTAKVSLVKSAYKTGYAITAGLTGAENSILLVIPKTEAGTYPLGTKQSQSSAFVGGFIYMLNNGDIITTTSGNKLSGNFKGKVYEPDGKGSISKKPSGDISGKFTDIIINP